MRSFGLVLLLNLSNSIMSSYQFIAFILRRNPVLLKPFYKDWIVS